MKMKKKYMAPCTMLAGCDSGEPIMVEMTLYSGSPYTTLQTITTGPEGMSTSDGQW